MQLNFKDFLFFFGDFCLVPCTYGSGRPVASFNKTISPDNGDMIGAGRRTRAFLFSGVFLSRHKSLPRATMPRRGGDRVFALVSVEACIMHSYYHS